MPSLAILFINFGPYHLARIQAAHQLFSSQGWVVIGIEVARYQTEYPWQAKVNSVPFQWVTLFGEQVYETTPIHVQVLKVLEVLGQLQPDMLAIAGYSQPAMLIALLWAKLNRKPAILLSDSKSDDAPRVLWKEWLKQRLISLYSAALVAGQPHKRYLQTLGMVESAIACGYDVVDNDRFSPAVIQQFPAPLLQPYFLSVSRFVPKKNLIFLIQAYAAYARQMGQTSTQAWHLVLCGDGEMRSTIESEIATLSLGNHVHLTGFLQQDALLPYFAHASCFVHASCQEQWGLVVNEAMAAGLPVLVSNQCGCFEDLVIEGVTGFGFDPSNLEELTQLMQRLSTSPENRSAIAQNAFDHIQAFSPTTFAVGLMQTVESTMNLSRP